MVQDFVINSTIMQPTKVFEVLNGPHPLPEQSEQLQKPWKLPPFVGNVGNATKSQGLNVDFYFTFPKNPDPSKMAILRTRTPAIQVQTLPLEGPRILRVGDFSMG